MTGRADRVMPTLHRRSFLGLAATAWAVMAPGRANAAPTGALSLDTLADFCGR